MKTRVLALLIAVPALAFAARGFNGTSAYLRTTTLPVTAPPFTMACWFWVNDLSATYAVLALSRDSVQVDGFRILAEGSTAGSPLRADTIVNGGGGIARTSTSLVSGQWMHAAGVWASTSSRRVLLNGGGAVTDTTSVGAPVLDAFDIGARSFTGTIGLFIPGRVAEVGVWSAALTDDEISSLARGVSPLLVRPSALVFYAPLVRDVADFRAAMAITDTATTVVDHPRVYRR